ncbi:hypothetical protein K6U37_24535 [Vibrio parahaemolyticus]|uniref:hypothetical protein n=1 Tax=Vibrio parahaemolyticus TaxID=670 RepID=UPI001EEC7503|nr:hypothetical protein [Vibrio parahaemolyticus]MCG6465414.1 hypothetical protein [Vibrio parahaemolyticus]MCG6492125.1 hypothetical protein [Vibrio parahaemolyticus]
MATSSFFSMCVGGILGHRFSLWRDRRKEHNEAVIPFKDALYDAGKECRIQQSFEEEIKEVRHHIPKRTLRELEKCYATYRRLYAEARRADFWDTVIELEAERADAIKKTLQDMDKLLKLK